MASVAVAVAAITVVGADPSSVSGIRPGGDAGFNAGGVDGGRDRDGRAGLVRRQRAVVPEKVSSSAVAPRMATPLMLRSPELSVNALAALVATARLSVVTPEMPRS